jgi:hypothetical protein
MLYHWPEDDPLRWKHVATLHNIIYRMSEKYLRNMQSELILITYILLGFTFSGSVCAPWYWKHKRVHLYVLCDMRWSICAVIVRKTSSADVRISSS